MSEKTIFISYRRDVYGKCFAGRIYDYLFHNGYDPFLDVIGLGSGKWETDILKEVSKRSHFILVITTGCLDACSEKDDWLRREFECAEGLDRNIVPILEESVDLD